MTDAKQTDPWDAGIHGSVCRSGSCPSLGGADFGVTRGDASLPYTLTMLGFGIGGILMGKLADRFGVMTPVILVTGRVDSEGLARARASDACAVLAKPFEAARLLAAVAAALG